MNYLPKTGFIIIFLHVILEFSILVIEGICILRLEILLIIKERLVGQNALSCTPPIIIIIIIIIDLRDVIERQEHRVLNL